MGSENVTGGDNQQETEWEISPFRDPQRLYAERRLRRATKIQSDLHGDMQSQAEMTWPPSGACPFGVTKVPKVAKFLVG